MEMTGQFHFALVPGGDEKAFIDVLHKDVFGALQPTRITSGFDHVLMKGPAPRQYVWQARVDLMTDAGYDFAENVPSVQELVKKYAVLIGVDTFQNMD